MAAEPTTQSALRLPDSLIARLDRHVERMSKGHAGPDFTRANAALGPNVAFSRHGDRAYVIASGGGVNSTLYTIDTESNTVVSSTSFGSTFLLAIAVSPNSDNIYLAAEARVLSQSGILVVDANGNEPTQTIAVGHLVFDLTLSRNGDRLYASDLSGLIGGQSGVLVVDTDQIAW